MLYYLTSGSYSDYQVHTILEGPDDADLSALQVAYVAQLSDAAVLEGGGGITSFLAWLSRLPGWEERPSAEYLTTYDLLSYQRREALVRSFGPEPQQQPCAVRLESMKSVLDRKGWHLANTAIHVWRPRIAEDGRHFWCCVYCTAAVEAGPPPPRSSWPI